MKIKHSKTRPICRVLTEIMSFRKVMAFFILIPAVSLPALAYGQNQAIALLDQYAAGQAAFTKIKVQYEASAEHDTKMSGPYAVHNGITRTYEAGMVLFDGTRFNFRLREWGEVSGRGRHTSRQDANYKSWLFDGKRFLSFTFSPIPNAAPNGSVSLMTQNEARLIYMSGDSRFLGYLFGDDERIDTILKRVDYIQVTRETDTNGTPGCFVLCAKTGLGTYAIWLDPEHGYNIVRAGCRRVAGDRLRRESPPLPAGVEVDGTMTITRFEKRGELWIPMEAAWTYANTNNGEYQYTKGITKRTAVELSPDFKAAGAFVPDDIHDGALFINDGQVYVHGRSGPRFVWRKGEIVPEVVFSTEQRRKSH